MRRVCCFFFFILIPVHAFAYVRTMSETGFPLYWISPSIALRVNPLNTSGLSTNDVSLMLNHAFTSWSNAGNVSYSYSQSTGYSARSGFDGSNTVYFSAQGGRNLGYGVVAITEVLYYLSTGQIAEADMVFNDNQFLFTTTEGDTGKTISGRTAIYLQDVATHEAGHAYGLDHSSVNKSSLIYTAFSGQFHLSEDDKSGISSIYGSSGARGALRGTIIGTNGGIFGAHILAINMNTGEVQAGTLSNTDGSFRIGDIPTGSYSVMMEPYMADISSISAYFQNINHRFCGGSFFRRRFYSACGSTGKATVVEVNSGQSTDLSVITPSCSQMSNPGGAPTTIASAKEISSLGGAQFGTLSPGDTHYYKIRNFNGDLQAIASTYSIYSPIDIRVEILSSSGASIGATSTDNRENPMPGGYINYDSIANISGLSTGDYIIKVSSSGQRLQASKYSAGYDLLDSSGHYLLMVGANGSYGASAASDMSACASVNNYSQSATYRSPASTKDEETITQGCGTLNNPSANGPGGGPLSGAIGQLFALAFLARITFLISKLVRAKR